ncbi:spo7-like protein [Sporothrix brasiliensis 5110]|uniref:Spo7-like protein n=1 Tax=Sporothrix brasiliensis 5110 TaxID=1398154 RepID=A0A0C2JD06_9PEZI|nr:spo7-like protein [Sporothrix brasiliensis 5110]KIH94812.1 spo7-like protein [Sporothrix brasiliensis 5110]
MADDLDSLVKGAPLPGRDIPATRPTSGVFGSDAGGNGSDGGSDTGSIAASTGAKASDPLSHTPSSPSMIYLNLLILEASLRAQYLALRARRRHHTFFLLILGTWNLGFGYALFLAPREDGSGVGGSVYWVVDVLEKVCFMGGIITAALVWATGIWDRGVRWPRRWFSVSNRGLRHINCKLVLLKRPWWAEWLATLGWFLTYGLLSNSGGASSYRYVEPALLREVDRELNLNTGAAGGHNHPSVPSSSVGLDRDEEKGGSGLRRQGTAFGHTGGSNNNNGHEEDLAPGGDYVKLLLLAKPFSPTFRENWELYRQEYWDRENERRALVRQKLKEQDRALRRATGGWFWWLPGRGVPHGHLHHHHHHPHRPHTPRGGSETGAAGTGEKHGHHPQHPRHAAVEREHRRTRSNSSRRSSMSMTAVPVGGGGGGGGGSGGSGGTQTTSSRSATPTLDVDDTGESVVTRKTSTGSSASERRRKKSSVSGPRRPAVTSDSRSVTPDIPSPLANESSVSSAASEGRRGNRA